MAKKFFVPSLFVLLSISAAVLGTYRLTGVSHSAGPAALAFALAAGASLPLVMHYSLPPAGRRAIGPRALMPAVAIVLALAAARGAVPRGGPAPRSGVSVFDATVLDAEERRECTVATVRCRDGSQDFSARVQLPAGSRLEAGDAIRFRAKPVPPPAPGEGPGTALAARGVRARFYLDDSACTVKKAAPGPRARIRAAFDRTLERHFKPDTSAVIKALYYGNTSHVPSRTIELFRQGGLLHALAASGENIAIIAAFPLLVLGLLRLHRKIMMAAALAAVSAYLYVSDMPVSLVRAGLMFMAFALQYFGDRERNPFNALFTAASLIILIMPAEIFNAGFHLSAGATLGILLLHDAYAGGMKGLHRFIRGPLSATLGAQAAVLPLVYMHMGDVNLSSFISGLAVTPLLALLMSGSALVTFAAALVPQAGKCALLFDGLWEIIAGAVEFFARLGGHFHPSGPSVSPLAWAGLLACYVLLLLPVLRRPLIKKAMPVLVIVAVSTSWIILSADRSASRAFAALPHDSGVLYIDGRGDVLRVAGRPPKSAGMRPAVEYIRRCGPRAIRLAVTSTDPTALNGYIHLLRRVPVTSCEIDGEIGLSPASRALFSELEREGIPHELVSHRRMEEYFPVNGKKMVEIY